MPAIEEILMIAPPLSASRMRMQTYFDTNQAPVKFVFKTLFHSSSDKSNGDFTLPKVPTKRKLNFHFILFYNQTESKKAKRQQKKKDEKTSNTGVVDQGVDMAKGVPSLVYSGLDGGSISANVELHSHGSRAYGLESRRRRR